MTDEINKTTNDPATATENSNVTDSGQDVWTNGSPASSAGTGRKPWWRRKDSLADIAEKMNNPDANQDWQKSLINRLLFASLTEQRRARRWGIFFKSLMFVYIGLLLFYVPGDIGEGRGLSHDNHVALIDIDGVISASSKANADDIVAGLRAAFKEKKAKAIILRLNTPGGSAVQAGYVYDEIKRLRNLHPDKKVYAVIMDMCASGGYYIAAATDDIYADKASLVGSIGVIINGFGFVDGMKKLGIERRMLTAGEHKGLFDPFSPIKEGEEKYLQAMLDGIHKQFINAVKTGRGSRLKDDPKVFSGLVWNGDESVALGLVDGLGSSSYVARDIIGIDAIVDYTVKPNYFDRFAERLGGATASILSQFLSSPELR